MHPFTYIVLQKRAGVLKRRNKNKNNKKKTWLDFYEVNVTFTKCFKISFNAYVIKKILNLD